MYLEEILMIFLTFLYRSTVYSSESAFQVRQVQLKLY